MKRVEKINGPVRVQHAFMSVADKAGLDEMVPQLVAACPQIMIYSTGGTYKKVVEILGDGAPKHVMEVSAYTGMPETKGGLVKSLHHKLFLGYLTEDYSEDHQADLAREGAYPIELLVGNFYPFEQTVKKEGTDPEDWRMNIDIGGPSALAAAAKNWHRVAVVTDPSDYARILDELKSHGGCTTARTRFELSQKAWDALGRYRTAIAQAMAGVSFDEAIKPYEVVGLAGGGE